MLNSASVLSFRLAKVKCSARGPTRIQQPTRIRSNGDVTSTAVGGGSGDKKVVWIQTNDTDCAISALESGLSSTILVPNGPDIERFRGLGRFDFVSIGENETLFDETGSPVGCIRSLKNAEDLAEATTKAGSDRGYVVLRASDWKIIPAENLVAAYQHNPLASLLAIADTAESSRVMLEALEMGVEGVVLSTSDAKEVRALADYLRRREIQSIRRLDYWVAVIQSVKTVGMGDRVCVDLTSELSPGEGLLVGNFSRGFFLVHSECEETGYIRSRPFRVNAGPVHCYMLMPDGKTKYLSELRSGDEVMVVNAAGESRIANIGRIKIEKRPLMLIDALTDDGQELSVLLQNAETVKVVGPAENRDQAWQAFPLPSLKPGHKVYIHGQKQSGRHAGVAIDEYIIER